MEKAYRCWRRNFSHMTRLIHAKNIRNAKTIYRNTERYEMAYADVEAVEESTPTKKKQAKTKRV